MGQCVNIHVMDNERVSMTYTNLDMLKGRLFKAKFVIMMTYLGLEKVICILCSKL